MNRWTILGLAAVLGLAASPLVLAAQDDIDVTRLSTSLDQLASDPTLGADAQAEQARARDAVARLAQANSRERAHALYMAERLVDLAKVAAQLQEARGKLGELDREHDRILLESSRREAEAARRELERQRLQYQMAQEEAARESARLQQQGMEASQAAEQARAEAEKARKLAAAQARVARAARQEAALAAQAARAMRSQMQAAEAASAAEAAQPKPAQAGTVKKPASGGGKASGKSAAKSGQGH